MPRKKGSKGRKKSTSRSYSSQARSLVSRHVSRHRRKGMGQKQAVAAALSEARRKGRKVPARRRAGTLRPLR
ncbi:MAG TPA: DUF6496 domain-containing protein, partial [Candidatus Thermoplasmatota archaeon]|nr:DUF6496 domain-containing protein [Candidatus Thermoplasmatota archaeon]